MRARLRALLHHRQRHLAEPLGDVGVLLEQLAEADRARETGRACTDDEHADLDAVVGRVGGLADVGLGIERRREVGRTTHAAPLRARRSSTRRGTIVVDVADTARSLNSKIGAFGSLLIATITFELCMPTLCCTAPEMPSAK